MQKRLISKGASNYVDLIANRTNKILSNRWTCGPDMIWQLYANISDQVVTDTLVSLSQIKYRDTFTHGRVAPSYWLACVIGADRTNKLIYFTHINVKPRPQPTNMLITQILTVPSIEPRILFSHGNHYANEAVSS